MKKGEGGSAVQGSAGPSGAQGAASDLERCDKPMGAVAVVEPQSHVIHALSPAVATLARGEEMIFMDKEQDGFVSVETSKGGGWVKKILVGP